MVPDNICCLEENGGLIKIGLCKKGDLGIGRMDEMGIWRIAKRMIDTHGEKAPMAAAMRMDTLRAEGNLDGAYLWARILSAISRLPEHKPTPVHPRIR